MYVTRPLSLYRRSPEAALEQPPKGSGFLVIDDEEEEEDQHIRQQRRSSRFQYFTDPTIERLPFPQDRMLTASYIAATMVVTVPVAFPVPNPSHFIPVIDQPLSSNRYYVIVGDGKYTGLVSACSTRANMGKRFFFFNYVKDQKPRAFDCKNILQQVEIIPNTGSSKGTFQAKSVVPDGFPASFLRVQAWSIYSTKEHVYPLSMADGIDETLRASMPEKIFSGTSSPSVVVGKWYCPYIFVSEDEMAVKDQMHKCMFYTMTLEKLWEEIEVRGSPFYRGKTLIVSTSIETERSTLHLHGEEVVEGRCVDGVWWFRSTKKAGGGVGIAEVIMEKMKREEERGGWVKEKEKVEVEIEESDGNVDDGSTKNLRCFVLTERFVLKRMDGTLLLTYDCKFSDKILSKHSK